MCSFAMLQSVGRRGFIIPCSPLPPHVSMFVTDLSRFCFYLFIASYLNIYFLDKNKIIRRNKASRCWEWLERIQEGSRVKKTLVDK
jgi:hypothetical protein